MWHADVRDTSPIRGASALEWAGWEIDEATAQRFLLLDMSHTPRYLDAFCESAAEEGREPADAVAVTPTAEPADPHAGHDMRTMPDHDMKDM